MYKLSLKSNTFCCICLNKILKVYVLSNNENYAIDRVSVIN